MQVSSTRKAPAFSPITITVTVESQEERLALLAYTETNSTTANIPNATSSEKKIMRDFLQTLWHHLGNPN